MSPQRTLTHEELLAEAQRRFGENPLAWAFRCPRCGDIATPADFAEAGAEPDLVGRECLGRHLRPQSDGRTSANGRGCDWVAYGLIPGPWRVVMPDGRIASSFALADQQPPDGVDERRRLSMLHELCEDAEVTGHRLLAVADVRAVLDGTDLERNGETRDAAASPPATFTAVHPEADGAQALEAVASYIEAHGWADPEALIWEQDHTGPTSIAGALGMVTTGRAEFSLSSAPSSLHRAVSILRDWAEFCDQRMYLDDLEVLRRIDAPGRTTDEVVTGLRAAVTHHRPMSR